MIPDPVYSRMAAALLASPHVTNLPPDQFVALRDALEKALSIEGLPPHVQELFADDLHEQIVEAWDHEWDANVHPRGRAGRFVRVHFADKRRKPLILRLGPSGLDLNVTAGYEHKESGAPVHEGGEIVHRIILNHDIARVEELHVRSGNLVPREFLTDGEASAHLDLLFLDAYGNDPKSLPWIGRLSFDEKAALDMWRSIEGFAAINENLRNDAPQEVLDFAPGRGGSDIADGDPGVRRSALGWAKLLDSAIAKAPPTDVGLDMFVFRGVRDFRHMFGSAGPRVGDRITDKGFVSTTTEQGKALTFATGPISWAQNPDAPAVIAIKLDKGTRGAWIPGAAGRSYGSSEEFTLPRGLTFEVVDVREAIPEEQGLHLSLIEMRVVGPEVVEAFEEIEHPRGRGGRWIRKAVLGSKIKVGDRLVVQRARAGYWVPQPSKAKPDDEVAVVRAPRADEEKLGATGEPLGVTWKERHGPSVLVVDAPDGSVVRVPSGTEKAVREEPDVEKGDPGTPDSYSLPPEERPIMQPGAFASIYDGFKHNGLRLEVVRDKPPHLVAQVYDENGEPAGAITNRISVDHGQVSIEHDEWGVTTPGRGFAEALTAHVLDAYERGGADRVELTAGRSGGGYVWSRWYDFDPLYAGIFTLRMYGVYDNEKANRAYVARDLWHQRGHAMRSETRGRVSPEVLAEFKSRFPTEAQIQAAVGGDESALDGTFQSPIEIARFGRDASWREQHPGGGEVEMWLGKRFLLGSNWRGTIMLGPSASQS